MDKLLTTVREYRVPVAVWPVVTRTHNRTFIEPGVPLVSAIETN